MASKLTTHIVIDAKNLQQLSRLMATSTVLLDTDLTTAMTLRPLIALTQLFESVGVTPNFEINVEGIWPRQN